MIQRLKSWESPRKEGRNNKGKGGAARARQLKKQQQMLRKKLKGEGDGINKQENNQKDQRGKIKIPSLFLCDRSSRFMTTGYCFSNILGLTHNEKETWFLVVNFMNQPYISLSETRFLRK